MISKELLAAIDEDLELLLESYLPALLKSHLYEGGSGGGESESIKLEIGNWVLSRLGYPTYIEHPQKPKRQKSQPSPKRDYRQIVFERDGYKCVKCGDDENLTADHIIPISKGGKTNMENLRTLCKSCNSSKGNRIETERVTA